MNKKQAKIMVLKDLRQNMLKEEAAERFQKKRKPEEVESPPSIMIRLMQLKGMK